MKLYLYFYTGLLPFIPLTETHLEIPLYLPKETKRLTQRQQLFLWIASILVVRPALFKHLEKRGIPVWYLLVLFILVSIHYLLLSSQTYAWVLNAEKDFKYAFDSGVAGVMTDYPSKLRQFLLNQNN